MTAIGLPAPRLRAGIARELIPFVAIGVLSTAAYAALYLALRPMVGAFAANALALAITAVGNTAANRRLTFGVRGWRSMLHDQLGGLVALGVALAITSGAAIALFTLVPNPDRWLELAVLLAANAAATLTRFAVLRAWISGSAGRTYIWSQS